MENKENNKKEYSIPNTLEIVGVAGSGKTTILTKCISKIRAEKQDLLRHIVAIAMLIVMPLMPFLSEAEAEAMRFVSHTIILLYIFCLVCCEIYKLTLLKYKRFKTLDRVLEFVSSKCAEIGGDLKRINENKTMKERVECFKGCESQYAIIISITTITYFLWGESLFGKQADGVRSLMLFLSGYYIFFLVWVNIYKLILLKHNKHKKRRRAMT